MSTIIPPFAVYLIGALFLPFLSDKLRKYYGLAFAAAGLLSVFALKTGTNLDLNYLGLTVSYLKVDKLSLVVGYAFAIIGLLAVIYSFTADKTLQVSAFLYVGSAMGAVFAGDFLTLYVFWELLAITGAVLIFLNKTEDSYQAGMRYLYFHIFGGVLLLGGIMLNFHQTNSFLITAVPTGLAGALMLLGVGINSAFIFLHTWLPDSYPRAPFMASVFLSVYTTKTAVYLLARTSHGMEFVAYLGAAMAVYGVTMALMQSNARKLLSYHIVSQVGYMVAGIGIGTALGINGSIFHLFNNIFYKTLLFMVIGAVIYKLDNEDLTSLGGLFRKMPFTASFGVVAALSIGGFPLFNGYASKFLIFEAAHGLDVIYLLLELAAVGTILSFLKFMYFGFFKAPVTDTKIDEAHPSMLIAMGGAAIVCVLTGIYPSLITNILPMQAGAQVFSSAGIVGALLLFGVTVTLFFAGMAYFEPHRRNVLDVDTLYIKGISSLWVIPAAFDWINNGYEEIQNKAAAIVKEASQPSEYISDFITNTVFAFFMDMWFINKSKMTPAALPEKSFGALTFIALPVSYIGEKTSSVSAYFDHSVIDRLVNITAGAVVFISNRVKKLQAGSVQLYAISMVVAMIILILLTKGGR